MDETLEIGLALVVDRLAFGVELDQIVAFDQFRRQRARHEESLRVVGMAHADMAIGVDDVFIGENAIGDDKIAQQVFELAHEDSIGLAVAMTLGRSTTARALWPHPSRLASLAPQDDGRRSGQAAAHYNHP